MHANIFSYSSSELEGPKTENTYFPWRKYPLPLRTSNGSITLNLTSLWKEQKAFKAPRLSVNSKLPSLIQTATLQMRVNKGKTSIKGHKKDLLEIPTIAMYGCY